MAYYLIRWALPHKGKPKHLTSLEYYLRWMVFLPLWFITFAPIAIAIVCAAFIGPLGLTFYVGFTGGFSHDETAILVFSGIVLVISLALNQIIQHRFLTQR